MIGAKVLSRHAVSAAVVAPIRYRDAQVPESSPSLVWASESCSDVFGQERLPGFSLRGRLGRSLDTGRLQHLNVTIEKLDPFLYEIELVALL